MCGISGVLFHDSRVTPESCVLEGMASAIAHRGPDALGIFADPGVGLVHRRLAILDLARGDQPIANEDGTVQVVFNGEIYNYPELRRELLQRGHTLRTKSDTEALVHLYEDYGDQLVSRLRGMFAFAIWDRRRRRLVLARDRVGLKPLYVYRDHEKLIFGSEIKAILACPGIDREIDFEALEDYLCYGVIPGQRSIFRRVQKLAPGHTLSITPERLDETPKPYWEYRPEIDGSRSVEQWKEAIAAKLEETVRAHLLADVPIGAFLSGGVDSSVIVSELARLTDRPVQTFSIGFNEAQFSELSHAREVARRFGCTHVEEVITPEAAASLDDLVRYYDEPFADSSAIPTMHVARLAAQHVKVVLTGDGGDEAFGGYARYAHDLAEARWRERLPVWLRRGPLRGAAAIWPKADWLPRPLRAKTRLTNLSLDPDAAYANTLSWSRRPLRRRLLAAHVVAGLNGYCPEWAVQEKFARASRGDTLSGMTAADVGMLLPDDFLVKVDRATMAFGLEARPPLVDHELLDLTARIPSEFKVRGGETKWIFKDLYRDRLPDCAVRRPKQGFEIPIDQWLRGPLRETFEDTALSPHARAAAFLEQREVRRLWNQHQAGVGRHGNVLWSLLVLSRWAEVYLAPTTANDGILRGEKAVLAGLAGIE